MVFHRPIDPTIFYSLGKIIIYPYGITPMPRNRNRKRGSKKTVMVVAKSAPKMSFSKRVLAVVNKQRELKVAVHHGELPILGTINGNSVLQVMPDVPQAGNIGAVPPASQEFYRDGNSITLKKIVMRGWITQKVPVDGSRTRYVVRHMILRQRSANAQKVLDNNGAEFQFNQLLENAGPFIIKLISINI